MRNKTIQLKGNKTERDFHLSYSFCFFVGVEISRNRNEIDFRPCCGKSHKFYFSLLLSCFAAWKGIRIWIKVKRKALICLKQMIRKRQTSGTTTHMLQVFHALRYMLIPSSPWSDPIQSLAKFPSWTRCERWWKTIKGKFSMTSERKVQSQS